MNIAVLAGGGLTETLQAGPLVAAIGEAELGHVILVAPPAAAPLGRSVVGTGELLPLAALGRGSRSPHSALLALRRRRLDCAAVCAPRMRGAVIAYAAGCARRVGIGGGPAAALLTERIAAHDERNSSAASLRLAPLLGARPSPHPWLDPGAEARARAEALLLGGGFETGRLLVAIVPSNLDADETPGVPRAWLRWEPERYALLANLLAERHGAGIVVLGSSADRALVDALLLDLGAPVLDLTALVDLGEMAAVTERCDLLVSGDSPALHIAAGVGTPTIGLFGASEGRRRGPFGERHRIVQAVADGSARDAISRIRVEDALAAVEARL